MLVIKTYALLMHFGLAFGVNRKYSFNVTDVCHLQYDDVISDDDNIVSLTACSSLCAENNCCSFLFDKTSHRCIIHSVFAPHTVTGCGWKYAEISRDICKGPMPYTPTAPNQCDHGYSYDASDNICRIKCVSYGSTYGKFGKRRIQNLNNRVLNNQSEQECKDACTAETTFECRTAEWNFDGYCALSVETALTKPDSYREDTSKTIFQRNCA